jgi:hypothetical protein
MDATATNPLEFVEFPKMARLSRECIITEKIDGTNAQILIRPGSKDEPNVIHHWLSDDITDMVIFAGSRTRWITPENDNFGFAAWVRAHVEELKSLPEGRHFGEWWGSGIQRGYGLTKGEKRFSLFNVQRFHLYGEQARVEPTCDPRINRTSLKLPSCVGLVPVLYRGTFNTLWAEDALNHLREDGSKAAPGFMKPEGIVCFHTAANTGFKKTLEKDESPKSLA